MADDGDDEIAKMSFETALSELETIVARLEEGKIGLEDAIATYERGEKLKSHCEKMLKSAEARIERITLRSDGTPSGTETLKIE
jgi:exodeoxyribonuclease VII small subunit